MISNATKFATLAGLAAATLLAIPSGAHAFAVFSDSFNAGPVGAEWSTDATAGLEVDTADGAPNETFLGLDNDGGADGLSNQTVILTLNGLGAHTEITLTFDLYMIKTLDGGEPFNLSVDGVGSLVSNAIFENLTPGGSSTNAIFGIADAINVLRTTDGNGGAEDDAVYRDKSFTFAHSASSLIVRFSMSSLQGLEDEGWGLDNARVASNFVPGEPTIPEPASLGLLFAGLVGLGFARRRRAA